MARNLIPGREHCELIRGAIVTKCPDTKIVTWRLDTLSYKVLCRLVSEIQPNEHIVISPTVINDLHTEDFEPSFRRILARRKDAPLRCVVVDADAQHFKVLPQKST